MNEEGVLLLFWLHDSGVVNEKWFGSTSYWVLDTDPVNKEGCLLLFWLRGSGVAY